MSQLSVHSPIGDLTISEEEGEIVSLDWGWSPFQEENEILLKTKFYSINILTTKTQLSIYL